MKKNATNEELSYDFDDMEDNEDLEYQSMLTDAMIVSEKSGIPFDHVMGEYLAGLR